MKVYVESVVEHTVAGRVPISRLGSPDQYVTEDSKHAVEVIVRAVVESEDEIPNWKACVGKTLLLVSPPTKEPNE